MMDLALGSITLDLPDVNFEKLENDLSKGLFKLKSRGTPLQDLFNDTVVTLHR